MFNSYVSLPEGISYGRDAIFFLLCHLLGDLLALHRFNLRFLGLTSWSYQIAIGGNIWRWSLYYLLLMGSLYWFIR